MVCWESVEVFRKKVEQAAELSNEPHPWADHDFALAPKDPTWLRHEMITAEDIETGKIIGFCEIAMLICPSEDEGSSLDFAYGDDYEDESIATTKSTTGMSRANSTVMLPRSLTGSSTPDR